MIKFPLGIRRGMPPLFLGLALSLAGAALAQSDNGPLDAPLAAASADTTGASPAAGQVARSEAAEPAPDGDWIVLPAFGYSPETRWFGGASAVYIRPCPGSDPDCRPSNLSLFALYTQERQILAGIGGEHYLQEQRYLVRARLGFQKFPGFYYGIGREAPEELEEKYTPRSYGARLAVLVRLGGGLRAGPSYELQTFTPLEYEAGGALATGEVTGSETGRYSDLGLQTNWDTRDDVWYPFRGSFLQAYAGQSSRALGSDYTYNRFYLDLRRYQRVLPHQILALRAYGEAIRGEAPFYRLAQLGGSQNLRGYYEGRYRDRALLILQAEYRLAWLFNRLGLALFGGLGDVAPALADLDPGMARWAYGVGLRYRLGAEERLNLRFDFAWGEDSGGFYISIGEAF